MRAWFTPGHGEDLSSRIAKMIRRSKRRVRICSPVITTGPGARHTRAGDRRRKARPRRLRRRDADPRGDPSVDREQERVVEAATARAGDDRPVQRQGVDAVWRRHRARLHARKGVCLRRHDVRRIVQPVAERREERRERAGDRGRRDRRQARRVRRRGTRALSARHHRCQWIRSSSVPLPLLEP